MVYPSLGEASYQGQHGTLGGDSSTTEDPVEAPGSTLLYLCLPLVNGSVGGDCYFPITCGTLMEKTRNKNL